jgi:predicted amidohydrolase YtcJ
MLAGHGVQTATHAIGDTAVGQVLSTLAQLPHGARRGHRLEHIEPLPDRLVPEFTRHGVTAFMQPMHAAEDTPRRPQRQLVAEARHRTGRSGMALPRPASCRHGG